jgi:hypothetical protein
LGWQQTLFISEFYFSEEIRDYLFCLFDSTC